MMMLEELKEKRTMSLAMGEAIKYGVGGMAVVGGSTVLASKFHNNFNKLMSISAKTSLPLMAGLFIFAVKYEHTMHDIQRNPEKWGMSEEVLSTGKLTKMPVHHRLLNSLYDNPYTFIIGLGLPLFGTILHKQLQLKHITLSQRIMHTRVFAQGGILCIALSTMAFREYMDKHGRFPEVTE